MILSLPLVSQALLEANGCSLNMFPELYDVLHAIEERESHETGNEYICFPEILMALAGIGDWAKDPKIIACLQKYGLRPSMPIEELFTYVNSAIELKV